MGAHCGGGARMEVCRLLHLQALSPLLLLEFCRAQEQHHLGKRSKPQLCKQRAALGSQVVILAD